ncbi:MAG: hypothetical protein D4R45_07280 [Planctomycetaceae bacterium]|nr:MAG: hypothetical protein D4R45_07280 [Planctomycetaceae bacterium]
MANTVTQNVTEVQALCGRENDDVLITTARVVSFLNFAQDRIIRRCPGHIDLETKDADAITLVASTFSYSFAGLSSPSVAYPLRLFYMNGTASKMLNYKDTDEFDEDYPSPSDGATGIPEIWTRRGYTVEIYPIPSSSEAGDYLRLDYTGKPTAFSTGSMTATCSMTDADEGLIFFALSEAFSAIGGKDQDAAKYRAKFEDWLEGYRMDKDTLFMAEGNSLLQA